ncbi:MAG: preprotein translocase subunit SecE [Gammaproteobacteria bacterium]|nr:preprotein translocase subunit SecE [Gammaproteobacteria bacterium]
MVAKTEASASALDNIKLALALLVLLVGVVGFYWFDHVALVWRVLVLLGLVGVAAGLVVLTPVGRGLLSFSREARAELRKVVWPTRQETLQVTLSVLVLVLVVGIFLWLVDALLFWVVRLITGQGG